MKRGGISMAIGGESWAGFEFCSYGRARDWRILTPAGESLTAPEIASYRAITHDTAYLKQRVAELAAKIEGAAFHVTKEEAALIRVAMQVLLREMPVQLGTRDARVSPAGVLRLA